MHHFIGELWVIGLVLMILSILQLVRILRQHTLGYGQTMINRWAMVDDEVVGFFLGEVGVSEVGGVAVGGRVFVDELEFLFEVEDIKFLRHEFSFKYYNGKCGWLKLVEGRKYNIKNSLHLQHSSLFFFFFSFSLLNGRFPLDVFVRSLLPKTTSVNAKNTSFTFLFSFDDVSINFIPYLSANSNAASNDTFLSPFMSHFAPTNIISVSQLPDYLIWSTHFSMCSKLSGPYTWTAT